MPTNRGERTEGSVGIRRGQGNLLTIEQDWHYRIQADSLSQDRYAILYTASGVPQFNVSYGGLYLQSADGTRRDDDPLMWDCTYHLSSQPSEGNDRDPTGTPQTGAPTAWVPLVDLSFEDYEEVLRKALNYTSGETIPTDPDGYDSKYWVNSAGQPFESGFVRQRRIVSRKFTQFEPTSRSIDTILGWNDVINHATYLGKPKRTLRLMLDAVTLGTYYGTRCYRCDFTLAYKADDWRLKQLDVGWYYKDEDDKLQPFIDETGNQILGGLDGMGGKAFNPREPAVLYFKEYEDMNLSSILRITT